MPHQISHEAIPNGLDSSLKGHWIPAQIKQHHEMDGKMVVTVCLGYPKGTFNGEEFFMPDLPIEHDEISLFC